jgi:hypothetical protein
MYRVRQQDLPFQGSPHHFVGTDNGDVSAWSIDAASVWREIVS